MISSGLDIYLQLSSVHALTRGWERVSANTQGGAGGDGQTVRAFGKVLGIGLHKLSKELSLNTYRPGPYRSVAIPKASGGHRNLNIPCVRDRIVQSALVQLMEQQFENEFEPMSFAYRKGKGVLAAVRAVEHFRDQGFTHVVEADITSYFDNVPITNMLERFNAFCNDMRLRQLVELWLIEADTNRNGRGLPQGSPLSPLLANLYLDGLDEKFREGGVRCVRYADDFVLLCKSHAKAERTLTDVRLFLQELGLNLHPEKTRILSFDQGFRYLGHLFVRSVALSSKDDDVAKQSDATTAPFNKIFEAEASEVHDSAHPTSGNGPKLRSVYLVERGRKLDTLGNAFIVVDAEAKEVCRFAPNWADRIEVWPNSEVTSAAQRLVLAEDITLHFVSSTGSSLGQLTRAPHGFGKLHLRQAAILLDNGRRLALVRSLVTGRIWNMRALLYRLNKRRHKSAIKTAAKALGRIIEKVTLTHTVDEARGMEAHAARIYWPALGLCLEHGFELVKRLRRSKAGPVPLVLDALSAILTRELDAMVRRAELHPAFGSLHVAQDDERNALAFDLVEAFRAPIAESLAVYLFNNRILQLKYFHDDNGQWFMMPEGRNRMIRFYEQKMTEVPDVGTGNQNWRGIINADIENFKTSLDGTSPFIAYRMSY